MSQALFVYFMCMLCLNNIPIFICARFKIQIIIFLFMSIMASVYILSITYAVNSLLGITERSVTVLEKS